MADNIVFEHAGSKQALLDLQSSKHHQDPPIGNEHGTPHVRQRLEACFGCLFQFEARPGAKRQSVTGSANTEAEFIPDR